MTSKTIKENKNPGQAAEANVNNQAAPNAPENNGIPNQQPTNLFAVLANLFPMPQAAQAQALRPKTIFETLKGNLFDAHWGTVETAMRNSYPFAYAQQQKLRDQAKWVLYSLRRSLAIVEYFVFIYKNSL